MPRAEELVTIYIKPIYETENTTPRFVAVGYTAYACSPGFSIDMRRVAMERMNLCHSLLPSVRLFCHSLQWEK